MLFSIERGWFRWNVYMLGHSIDDRWWLASFRDRNHAQVFIDALRFGWMPHAGDDPVNDIGAKRC